MLEQGPNEGQQNDSDVPAKRVSDDIFRAWEKAEEVAMHFNDQIQGFRLKALGAVTVGSGLIGSVVLQRETSSVTFYGLAAAMTFLAVVWGAFCLIDSCYYRRLLRGAVKEAIRLEALSNGTLQLSTLIKAEANSLSGIVAELGGAVWLFYLLPLFSLIGAAVLALVAACL